METKDIKILNREGSKFRYKESIIAMFPTHKVYIEPFFGSGGIYFNKEAARYNHVNDRSNFIFELWSIFRNKEGIDKLLSIIEKTIISLNILNTMIESTCKYERIAGELLLGYCSLYGQGSTLKMLVNNSKEFLIKRIVECSGLILENLANDNVTISNKDIFIFLDSLAVGNRGLGNKNTFIYCDPPYSVSKGFLKDNKSWGLQLLEKLIEKLIDLNVNFAISEFNDQKVIDTFNKYNLNINIVSKSTGIASIYNKNKNEILATNYKTNFTKLIQDDLFKKNGG